MQSLAVKVGVAAAILIGGFVAAVAVLNNTVYSPAGFIQTYVNALDRRDPTAALRLAGPNESSSALDDLLTEQTMVELHDIVITTLPVRAGDPTGHRFVTVEYVAAGRVGTAEFEVEPAVPLLGIFQQWTFTKSPLTSIDLTVLHTREFTANGVAQVTPVTNGAATYLAFTPGALTFEHTSQLLAATPQTVVLGNPGRTTRVQLIAAANQAFTGLVQTQTTAYLADCAAQQVLYPVGCPFGQDIADRLASAPVWSILEEPAATLQATPTLGEWIVPVGSGVAAISVDVRSIYDGSVSPFTAEVPFRIGYVVTFVGENEIVVTPRVD